MGSDPGAGKGLFSHKYFYELTRSIILLLNLNVIKECAVLCTGGG